MVEVRSGYLADKNTSIGHFISIKNSFDSVVSIIYISNKKCI